MKLTLAYDNRNRDRFVALFHVMKQCCSIVNLSFLADSLYIQSMDSAHVCLFEMKITQEWFTSYETSKGDTGTIGITTQSLFSVLDTMTQSHDITLHYTGEPDTLHVDFQVNEKKKTPKSGEFDCQYTIPLVDCEYDLLSIPDLEYDLDFTISSKKITDIMKRMTLFGEAIRFVCDDTSIQIVSSGVHGELNVALGNEDVSDYSIVENETINVGYNLNYLAKMCITVKLTDEIGFHISKNSPIKIAYDLGQDSHVWFYLAPIMDD